jgi:hypothetical protein
MEKECDTMRVIEKLRVSRLRPRNLQGVFKYLFLLIVVVVVLLTPYAQTTVQLGWLYMAAWGAFVVLFGWWYYRRWLAQQGDEAPE